MGKAVKAIGIGVAIIGLAVLTGGISLAPTLTGSLAAGTAAIGTALTTTALGGLALSLGAGMILTGFSTLMRSTPRIPLGHLDRLNASLNPTAPRTIVFGETALGTDIRYVYPSGAEQRYIDYIIGHACHKLESIDEVWSEDRKAWTSAGGYQGWTVVGGVNRLTITTRLEGSAANAINVGGAWAGTARLTGCAYSRLWIDRQGTKKTDSPFAGGLATRLTFRGKGMPLYDPRLDSTNGGSGTHRPDDQTTWGTASGRDNPVLQILAYLLGWRIGGKLSVGRGVPPERLDLASFITAANVCDESVALAGGGTQARYRTAGIFNEADDTNAVLSTLLTSCAGELRETGGKLGIYVLTNDLASPVAYFDDNNILSQFEWSGEADLTETPNVVRGRYTDPSDNALYNLVDYPEHSIASLDGVERVLTLDLPAVQDGRRAQRIAKQALQRAQYTGTFSAEFDVEAWKCTVGNIVALSLEPMGWSNKLFRVVQMAIRQDGRVPMVLREENAAIYAWAADESAVVEAAAPTTFDPLNAGAMLAAVEAATTANWSGVNDDGGKPESGATRNYAGQLLKNLSFESAYWSRSGGFSIYDGDWVSTAWARATAVLDCTTTALSELYTSARMDIAGASRLYFAIKVANVGAVGKAPKLTCWFYNADGDYLGSYHPFGAEITAARVPDTTSAVIAAGQDVPATAVQVVVGIKLEAGSAGSGYWAFGEPYLSYNAPGADVTGDNNAGGLISGAAILQNGGSPILVGASPFDVLVTDGDVIAFSPQLAVTPKESFDLTGLPAVASGESYSARAESLTGTGCTVRIKKRTSGGAVSTLSTGAGSVITTDLEYQVSKGDSRDARDSKYKMRLQGDVYGVYQAGGGGGWFDHPFMLGGMTIEIFAKVSSAWQSCGVFSITPPYGVTGTHSFDETFTFTCANAIGDPSGNEFRALVLSRAFPGTDKLTALHSVTWQIDGTSVTETAVTQAVTMRIQPQNV